MESPLLEPDTSSSPHHPSGPTPPPRNSMEDADSSVKRKRPRLDSGQRTYHNMNMGGEQHASPGAPDEPASHDMALDDRISLADTTFDQDVNHPSVSSRTEAGTPERQLLPQEPVLAGTPSKVTLNLREHSASSLPTAPAAAAAAAAAAVASEPASTSAVANQHLPADEQPVAGSPATLVGDETSSDGIEIEAAEPEYIDSPSGHAVWRDVTDLNYAAWNKEVMSRFPVIGLSVDPPNEAFQHYWRALVADPVQTSEMIRDTNAWLADYLNESAGWNNQWSDLFLIYAPFWANFAKIFKAIPRPEFQEVLELACTANVFDREALVNLLCSLVDLTTRLLRADKAALEIRKQDRTAPVQRIAKEHLQAVSLVFGSKQLIGNLDALEFTALEPESALDRLQETIYQEYSFLRAISDYWLSALDRNDPDPDLLEHLVLTLKVAADVAYYWLDVNVGSHAGHLAACYCDFWLLLSDKMSFAVKKQFAMINSELLAKFCTFMEKLLPRMLHADPSLLHSLTHHASHDFVADLDAGDRQNFAGIAWKLDFLERCVREGRMEIRIVALENLSKALIDVYRDFIHQNSPPFHPIVAWTSERLKSSKIIDYLFGVESHPQIVNRSNNVVGFLAASHTYSDDQTDMIWDCALTTEDSRMFDAIMGAMSTTFGLMDREAVHYFCSKFHQVPAADFGPRCRTFLNNTLTAFHRSYVNDERIDLLPHLVLLRLLREIASEPGMPIERRYDVWTFVADCIKRLQFLKWDFDQRVLIYEECLKDLREKDGKAVGSCLMLNRLLSGHGRSDFFALDERTELVPLVVAEFVRLKSSQAQGNIDLEKMGDPVKEMLQLVEKILLWAPDSLPAHLVIPLWSSMVGEDAVGKQARHHAWESLAHVASNATVATAFLDVGVSDFLPTLDPLLYSRSLLSFAHRLSEYQGRIGSQSPSEAKASAGMHESLFWQIALDSPDDQMAHNASRYLVEKVVHETRLMPKDHLSDGQSDFIHKAVTRLIDAARERKQVLDRLSSASAEMNVSDPEVRHFTVRFQRAFVMLKQLGQGLKSLEQSHSPTQRSDSQTSRRSIHGERVQIKYQSSERGVPSPIRFLEIGDQSTVADLVEWIEAKTGFAHFNLIAGGQKVNQEAMAATTIADANLFTAGLVLIHKIPGTESAKAAPAAQKLKPLEQEIMKYFSELYALLSVDRLLGQSIHDFLITFPPHEDVVRRVTGSAADVDSALPLSEPFKLLYSLHAMQAALHRQNDEGAIDDEFMVRCVKAMIAKFLALKFDADIVGTADHTVAIHLVYTLIPFLKERVQPQVRARYFDAPSEFVDQTIRMCQTAGGELLYHINQTCFTALLEAVLLNSAVWQRFTTHPLLPKICRLLLLTNPKAESRESVKKSLMSVLATLPRIDEDMSDDKEQYKKDMTMYAFEEVTFIHYVWQTLLSILPDSAAFASNSAQFFELCVDIFRRLNEISPDAEILQRYLNGWLLMLLEHDHDEILGQDRMDQFVRGLSELIYQSFLVFDSLSRRPQIAPGILDRILSVFLFPPIVDEHVRTSTVAVAPILSSETRRALYAIVVRMSNTNDELLRCVETANDALEDLADANIAWSYERQKEVRSAAGYPGLVNLSNTCYLNSLMTQLFMNPRFREFILNLELHDPNAQRLLFALRQLFVDLQDGWAKAAITRELADSIETYDGPLDPSIQMDADEAFNLIFDRIESQLSSAADKQEFKTIFGGQIVQQIKSKECDHISERLEPVTAVQCDIQGKMGLEDSLKAYIEGETMEGENKYKCSTCDRYVNAVKRACLRDIPDNLIFHLKRFDYDLVQGTRNKVNDYFAFPERIDMTPYTDKYLVDQEPAPAQDVFLLTGVLVHSGTAELGHYYSFIRERPLALNTWVEFNDADVSRYDVRAINDHCFGGEARDQFSGVPFPKMYSAYMLFYQRESSMVRDDEQAFKQQQAMQVVRAQIPTELAMDIAVRNERLARVYCLFDLMHERFLGEIHRKRQQINGAGSCTADHRLETTYMECLWRHVLYIFGKEHQRTGCVRILSIIMDMMAACNVCCTVSIDWLLGDDETRLRLLLLKQTDHNIRAKGGSILREGMIQLKVQSPSDYGSPEIDSDMDEDAGELGPHVDRFKLAMHRLRELQKLLPHTMRPWHDFYDLLTEFTRFGRSEKIYLHHLGFLQHAMEVLSIDNERDWSSLYRHQGMYMKMLEKKQFSLVGLCNFVGTLLPFFKAESGSEYDEDPTSTDPATILTRNERATVAFALRPTDSDKIVPWLVERLANSDDAHKTGHDPIRNVVRWMIENDAALGHLPRFEGLIQIGLEKNPAWLAEPYLHVALAYAESSPDGLVIERILRNVSQSIRTIGTAGGFEHYDFFRRARQITNAKAFPDRPHEIKFTLLRLAPQWTFTLLLYQKDDVGPKTRQLMEDMLFPKESDGDDEEWYDAKTSAFNGVFALAVRDLHKYLGNGQHVGEHVLELVKFCDDALPYAYAEDDDELRASKILEVRRLLERVSNMIVVSDEGSNGNADSDDMSETSSTKNNPYDAKGYTSADPIVL